MIYSFNTLGFYTVKANRQYDNTDNRQIIHKFETNKLPAFLFAIPGTITTATYRLLCVDETVIKTGSCALSTETNNFGTTYSIISLSGATTTLQTDGYYYIEVTCNTTAYYSDVFEWVTDVSELLKINAVSTGLAIGVFPVGAFTYTMYIDSNDFTEEHEVTEEGEEKTYGNVPAFVSVNRKYKFDLVGYNKTLQFLSGLRALLVNGSISLTWKGETVDIYDMVTESSGALNYNIYPITVTFKLKDYIQTINTI